MWQALIGPIMGLIGNVVDKAVPDRNEAERLKADITQQLLQRGAQELQGAVEIIKAEAGGESWLQRNWRPLTMLSFLALLFMYWLGIQPENLTQDTLNRLFELLQIGIGGYIMGRSAEKGISAYFDGKEKSK